MRVSVVGLGTMGRAVALRLLERGHEVTVWNRTAGRADDIAAQGAWVAGTLADAVAGAEVVLTLLTADEAVREVYLGTAGIAASVGSGTVVADMSSIHPRTSREVAGALGDDRFVDAPILAGPATITSGEALLVVGGSETALGRLRPLFADLSARCVHGGPVGSGTTVKLVFNLLFLEELAALGEAVALAQGAGLAPELVAELFGSSAMVPAGLQNRLADVIGGDHSGWFPVPLARKDIRLAGQLATESNVSLRLAAAADEAYAAAESAGHAEHDVAAVVEAARRGG